MQRRKLSAIQNKHFNLHVIEIFLTVIPLKKTTESFVGIGIIATRNEVMEQ